MSEQLAVIDPSSMIRLGEAMAKSGYFQDAREAAQATVKIMAGHEVGLPPVASMTGIHIVKGRVTFAATTMAALVKRSGRYDYRVVEMTEKACKIEFHDKGETIGESTFTMEDAVKAGLTGNETYKKFPRNMLFARAMSNGAKFFCPDVFGGPVYTPDELEDVPDEPRRPVPVDGRVIESAPPSPPDPEAEEKASLLAAIGDLAKRLEMTPTDRRHVWDTTVGKDVAPADAPLDALIVLRDELAKVEAARGKE